MSTPSRPAPSPRLATGVLLATSLSMLGLSIYQWLELIEVRSGKTPACAINETINCTAVWNSPFAHTVHEWVGFPVAGLGVWWAVVAAALALLRQLRLNAGGDGAAFTSGVKFWALAGLLSCVTFVTASIQAKAVCLTCVGTYALVVGYGVAALGMLGGAAIPSVGELLPGVGWSFALMAPVYLGLLYPGLKTPRGGNVVVNQLQAQGDHAPNAVEALFESLPPRELEMTSWARNQWVTATAQDRSRFPVHARKGDPAAKVQVVEFTDILCGHCAQFEQLMHEIERMVPPGTSFSVEPRYYPLDGECNPDIKGSAKDGVRCFGAKLQICAEGSPKFFDLRNELFANQQQLDQGLMLAIAQRHGLDGATLQACIKAPETEARLLEDITFARENRIEGTPLVLINGKIAPPAPAFLLGMIASGGDADAPVFKKLPPPPADLK